MLDQRMLFWLVDSSLYFLDLVGINRDLEDYQTILQNH
jgi:hypothetical protein